MKAWSLAAEKGHLGARCIKWGVLYCALLLAALPCGGRAQILYEGGVYSQDFNTLQSGTIYTSYTNLPVGWIISSTYNSGSYVWTTVTNGYSNNYVNS